MCLFVQDLNVSGITLTPEDLLSLGYQTDGDTGKTYNWQDYWKLIIDVVDTSAADYLVAVSNTRTCNYLLEK